MNLKVIVLHPLDNVATAIVDLEQGELVHTSDAKLKTTEAVPFGHKIALRHIARGSTITKYGEAIGCAGSDIGQGDLVHVHNLDSQRGRGDLEERKDLA